MKYMLYIGAIVLFAVTDNTGQTNPTAKETPSSCEYIRTMLDSGLSDSVNLTDSFLIFVLNPGNGEKFEKVGKHRKAMVKNHLTLREPMFSRYLIVTGERRKGLGSLVIYTEGKINGVIYFAKNKILDNCKN